MERGTREEIEKAKEVTRKDSTYKISGRVKDGATPFLIHKIASIVYGFRAKKAAEDLVNFLDSIGFSENPCVMYFDEADSLESILWILLRLLTNQKKSMAIWYVFISTKASFGYFNPDVRDSESSMFFRT
jgi:hypothetical protein